MWDHATRDKSRLEGREPTIARNCGKYGHAVAQRLNSLCTLGCRNREGKEMRCQSISTCVCCKHGEKEIDTQNEHTIVGAPHTHTHTHTHTRTHTHTHTHTRQASFIRGGGYFGQDPPTQLWTHPPNF